MRRNPLQVGLALFGIAILFAMVGHDDRAGAGSSKDVLERTNYHVRIAIARNVDRIAMTSTGVYHVVNPSGETVYQLKPGSIHYVDIVKGRPGGKIYRLVLRELDGHLEQSAQMIADAAEKTYRLPTKAVRFPVDGPGGEERLLVLAGAFPTLEAAREHKAKIGGETIRHIFEENAPPLDGEVLIRDHRGRTVASDANILRVVPNNVAANSLYVDKSPDWTRWKPSDLLAGRHYRGNVELALDAKGSLTVVNDLWIEYYLYGVVAAEIGNFAPTHALKAQAVVARSEAVAKIQRGIVSSEGLYQFNDSTEFQSYPGKGAENEAVRMAVDETRGEILVHDGKPVDAVYSHSCGGVLSSAFDMWDGEGLDYSKRSADRLGERDVGDLSNWEPAHRWTSRVDIDCFCNPNQKGFPEYAKKYFRWVKSLTVDQMTETIGDKYGLGRIKDVTVYRRTKSGRVRGLRVVGEDGTKNFDRELSIRGAFGKLRSTFFTFTTEYDDNKNLKRIVIYGAGYGHGVGMCQMGAYMMARQDYTYRQILGHYFSKVKIRRLYG